MAARKQKVPSSTKRPSRLPVRIRLRAILPLFIVILAVYALLPRLPSFDTSLTVLRRADVRLVLAAIGCVAATNVAAALVYKLLVTRPIRYWPMVLIQLASSFTNRLLPAGTGAMATSAAYLMKRGHTAAQAGSIALLNNTLGFIGNILLIIIIAFLSSTPLGVAMPAHIPVWVWLVLMAVVVMLLVVALWWRRARRVLRESLGELARVARQPWHVMGALAASMVLTTCFAGALFASAHAVAVHLTFLQAMYVLTAGVAAVAIAPIPGGIGAAEAGLVAAMVSVGIPPSPALAVALLYRLVSFWLPILPGFIGFQIALQKRLV